MSLTSIVRAMVVSGATPKMILAVVEAEENDRQAIQSDKLSKGAERQRRYRELRHVTSRNVTACDTPPNGSDGFPCTPSLTPLTSLTPTKENPPKGGQKKNPPMVIELPPWLPLEAWEGFREMRIKIKKPMTARAERLALGKLEQFRSKGHDPTEILNQSTLSNYQDLYLPKENNHAATFKPHQPQPRPDKPTWRTEGERLAAKYREIAEREEQAAAFGNSEPNLRLAETIRQDSG